MPGRERNGKQIREGDCGQTVSNTSERLRMTLLEKSPLLTFKRTLMKSWGQKKTPHGAKEIKANVMSFIILLV